MVRYLLAFVLLVFSQLSLANNIAKFFDQLEGIWTLDRGMITTHHRTGNTVRSEIKTLKSHVEKISSYEWRFTEEYCEQTCSESTFSYILENDKDLYLVNEEGKHLLFVMNATQDRLVIRNISSSFQTQIECEINQGMFYQRGFTILPDFTNIQTDIDLKRP